MNRLTSQSVRALYQWSTPHNDRRSKNSPSVQFSSGRKVSRYLLSVLNHLVEFEFNVCQRLFVFILALIFRKTFSMVKCLPSSVGRWNGRKTNRKVERVIWSAKASLLLKKRTNHVLSNFRLRHSARNRRKDWCIRFTTTPSHSSILLGRKNPHQDRFPYISLGHNCKDRQGR